MTLNCGDDVSTESTTTVTSMGSNDVKNDGNTNNNDQTNRNFQVLQRWQTHRAIIVSTDTTAKLVLSDLRNSLRYQKMYKNARKPGNIHLD